MADETLNTSITIDAPADAVFAVLADPTKHPAIDGTGWVRQPRDPEPLTKPGQVFRMAMYHANHPDGHYEMANMVRAFERPYAISWEPGQDPGGDGKLRFGGWIWRYDLVPIDAASTEVTLTYDWSAVPAQIRQHIQFPPFPRTHLENSLRHLVELVAAAH